MVLLSLVALVLGVLWFVRAEQETGGEIDPDDRELVALGAEVYASACATCHGVDLEGQPDWQRRREDGSLPAPPHDETGHTWHHADEVLFSITKHGPAAYAPAGYRSDMPGFEGVLSDEEIRAVLAFIKSRWPEDIRLRQERMDTR